MKKLVLDKTTRYRTFVIDFGMWQGVERWENARLKDSFFCQAGDLWPDGSLRNGKTKYFFSPYSGEEIKKEVGPIDSNFKFFDYLYYHDEQGEIRRVDGTLAKQCTGLVKQHVL